MKTTFTSLTAILLGASTVLGALAPAPTPHHHIKRQQFPDGLDVHALLANPSSYLENISSALNEKGNAQKYVALWASATNDPAFHQSLSKVLVNEFGSKTAEVALAQYSSVAAECDLESTSSSVPANTPVANTPVNNADASNSSVKQVSNAVTSGAASSSSLNLAALAVAAIPAVLVAVL